ncbi:MAG TPA: plastocyanin/azurin family copper-binding protein [Chthoniobacteraceae bacterium]|jgi:azurin|nr:plastocyanin/azurin family copper-binding protein [Chthoniobacteraceae bacterium]
MNRIPALICILLLAIPAALHADDKAVQIKAGDQMKYDVTTIEAAPGQKVTVTLTNAGVIPKAAMAHNFVLLKAGTDVTAFAMAAMTHQAEGYMPPEMADKVIAATKLVGPGESETVTFIAPAAGTYDYLCTFPGHALAGMRGLLVVK